MNVVDCIQGDPAWFKCRLGVVTSSRIAAVISRFKRIKDIESGKERADRRDMRFELMCELLTERASEHYVRRWMKEGKEKEPLARAEYEMAMDVSVEQVGFVYHPTIKMAGCSPDMLIGEEGMGEIKCPMVETHLEYIIGGVIPEEYIPQMLWQLACCPDRQWNDFVSYHPDMKEPYKLFIKRLPRNKEAEALIRGYELDAVQLLSEVAQMLSTLRQSIREEVGA